MSNWKVDDRGIPNIWQKRWKALRKELNDRKNDGYPGTAYWKFVLLKMTEITRKIK